MPDPRIHTSQHAILIAAAQDVLGLASKGDRCQRKALRDRGFLREDRDGTFWITPQGRGRATLPADYEAAPIGERSVPPARRKS